MPPKFITFDKENIPSAKSDRLFVHEEGIAVVIRRPSGVGVSIYQDGSGSEVGKYLPPQFRPVAKGEKITLTLEG